MLESWFFLILAWFISGLVTFDSVHVIISARFIVPRKNCRTSKGFVVSIFSELAVLSRVLF